MGVMEAGGAGVRRLISRLQELEKERARLLEEQRRLEAEKAETRLDGPTPRRFKPLGRSAAWEAATERKKQNLCRFLLNGL